MIVPGKGTSNGMMLGHTLLSDYELGLVEED
jgi:hypothetical protein